MISILFRVQPVVLCLAIPLLQQGTISKGYRGIVPLRTTRSQVEKLLGPSKTLDNLSTYYFQNEAIEIFYSRYRCGDSRNLDKWNVSPNTVISVKVIPNTKFPLAELPFDFSKFKQERGSFDALDESRLISDEDGITLAYSSAHNMIDWYAYGPKLSDQAKRCPGYSVAEEQRLRDCMPYLFVVECSSEEISVRHPVSCSARFEAPLGFSPTIDWLVSKNAFLVRNGQNITVSIKSSKMKTVLVSGEVSSPNICMKTASIALRVKSKNRSNKNSLK